MKRVAVLIMSILAVLACNYPVVTPTIAVPTPAAEQPTATSPLTSTDAPTPTSTNPPAPTVTTIPRYGPDTYPEGINPLTGQPGTPERRPLLVKVSNSPSVVRPQSGLQAADHVWEHQVEGFSLTRFSVILYSQTADRVGSVRSGRPPDLEIVPMYGALYAASGFSTNHNNASEPWRMKEYVRNAPWQARTYSQDGPWGIPAPMLFRSSDAFAPHNLFANPDAIWEHAAQRGLNQRPDLSGLVFSPAIPEGGTATTAMTIDYPGRGPEITWRYDAESGRWLRWQDGTPHTDSLTGAQVGKENVVVVYATHYQTNWPEDVASGAPAVDADVFGSGDAVLFRDGQSWQITWQREGSESGAMIRFFDAQGQPIAFRPGQTWFQLASSNVAVPSLTTAEG